MILYQTTQIMKPNHKQHKHYYTLLEADQKKKKNIMVTCLYLRWRCTCDLL